MPPPAPSCSVYLRDDAVFILTCRQVRAGWTVAQEPVLRLNANASETDLGDALKQASSASAVAEPAAAHEFDDMIPRATGFRSWTALERGARYLSVTTDGGEHIVQRFKYAAGGWEGENSLTIDAGDFDVLAATVLELAKSTQPRGPARLRRPAGYSRPEDPPSGDIPEAFGYKSWWLAISSPDPQKVAEALRLTGLHPRPWREGAAAAFEHFMRLTYVTPSVEGWVLAILANVREDEAHLRATLEPLSRQFGEAQAYINVRTSDAYTWARAEGMACSVRKPNPSPTGQAALWSLAVSQCDARAGARRTAKPQAIATPMSDPRFARPRTSDR